MSRSSVCAVLSLAAACAVPALAQAPRTPVPPEVGNTVLIAQYQCNPAEYAKVDQLLKEVTGPVLDRMVAEGKLLSWGVLATSVGGPVNRTILVWAKDPVALMKAREEYLPEIMAKPGWADLARACPTQATSISKMILRAPPAAK